MDCNIIKDLIPLYIDNCCSAESAEAVKSHLESCPGCKSVFDSMSEGLSYNSTEPVRIKPVRVTERRASVLQTVLLFLFFGIITIGVAKEAATPDGPGNGFWAFTLVVPATGFMLSLANWFFVRLYKSKKAFSVCSALFTLLFSVMGFVWSIIHYFGYRLSVLKTVFNGAERLGFFGCAAATGGYYGLLYSVCFIFVLCVVSKLLSNLFAKMLGKV